MLAAQGRYRLLSVDADLATPLHHLDDIQAIMQRGRPGVASPSATWCLPTSGYVAQNLLPGFGNVPGSGYFIARHPRHPMRSAVFEAEVARSSV